MKNPFRLITLCAVTLGLMGCLESPEPSTDVSYFCVELNLGSEKCDCVRSAMADFSEEEMLLSTSIYRATKANWKKWKPENADLVMRREIDRLGFGSSIRKKNPRFTEWARKVVLRRPNPVRQCNIRERRFGGLKYMPTEKERWYREKRDEYFGWLRDLLE